MSSRKASFLELPLLPAHRALLIHLLTIEPLHDAMNVEAVGALTPDERAVIAGKFTIRTAAVEGHATNSAVVVVRNPLPHRHSGPILYLNLHGPVEWRCFQRLSNSGFLAYDVNFGRFRL